MTHALESAILDLYKILREECRSGGTCVAVDVRFTSEGYYINYEHKPVEGLKKEVISMRNICGEWVK